MSDLQCAASLVLVRHAEAEYESDRWSDAGGSLTPIGRRQAADLGDALADRRIAHVWCSSLARAVQTAEIAAARLGVGVTTRDGLREFGVGDLAGTAIAEDPFGPWFAPWLAGDLTARVPGAESGLEVRDRLSSVLEEIADRHRGETVLVVSHGGIVRSMVPQLCRMEVPAQRVAHCAPIELRLDADDRVCTAWTPPGV